MAYDVVVSGFTGYPLTGACCTSDSAQDSIGGAYARVRRTVARVAVGQEPRRESGLVSAGAGLQAARRVADRRLRRVDPAAPDQPHGAVPATAQGESGRGIRSDPHGW